VDNEEISTFMDDDDEEDFIAGDDPSSEANADTPVKIYSKSKQTRSYPFDDIPFQSLSNPEQFQNVTVEELSGGAIKKVVIVTYKYVL